MTALVFLIWMAGYLFLGQSRSGKTTGLVEMALRGVGRVAKIICDPQWSLAFMLLLEIWIRGWERYVRFIRPADLSRNYGFIQLKQSTSENPLVREMEDQREVRSFLTVLMDAFDLDPFENRLIYERLRDGAQLLLHTGSPPDWLAHAFRPHSDHFWHMVKKLPESQRELKRKLVATYGYGPRQLRDECAPPLRIAEWLEHPAFMSCVGSNSLSNAIRNKLVVVVTGDGLETEVNRLIQLFAIHEVIRHAQLHDDPVELHMDECAGLRLWTPGVANATAMLQKQHFSPFYSSQTLTGKPEVVEQIVENLQIRRFYRLGNVNTIRFAAADVGTALLDPNLIDRQERRVKESLNGTIEESFDHYRSLPDQERLVGQRLQKLPDGAFYENDHGHVTLRRPPKPREWFSWPGLAEQKVEQCIQAILSSPEYSIPKIVEPQKYTKEDTERIIRGSNGHKQKQGGPKSGKKGMRKSSNGRKRTRAR